MLNQSQSIQNDEIGMEHFVKAVQVLWKYKVLIASCSLVALVLVAFTVAQMSPVWEGSGLIQIGQVEQIKVDNISNIITAVTHPSFKDLVVKRMEDNHTGTKSDYKLFYKSLKVRQEDGSDLIEIKVRSTSPDVAEKIIKATAVQLEIFHNEITKHKIDLIKNEVVELEQESTQTKSLLSALELGLRSTKMSPFEIAMTATISQAMLKNVKDLERKKEYAQNKLVAPFTFSTSIINGIHVSAEPIKREKKVYCIVALLLGFGIGVLYAFIKEGVGSLSLENSLRPIKKE